MSKKQLPTEEEIEGLIEKSKNERLNLDQIEQLHAYHTLICRELGTIHKKYGKNIPEDEKKNHNMIETLEQWARNMVDKYCYRCGKDPKNKSMFECGRCRSAQYCGIECQKRDWKCHKHVCVPYKCFHCEKVDLKKRDLIVCEVCMRAWYCDEECKKKDKERHEKQKECKPYQCKICKQRPPTVLRLGPCKICYRELYCSDQCYYLDDEHQKFHEEIKKT